MRFSGKMRLMIKLKVTKNQDFTLSLSRKHNLGKTAGCQIDPPPTFLELIPKLILKLKLKLILKFCFLKRGCSSDFLWLSSKSF